MSALTIPFTLYTFDPFVFVSILPAVVGDTIDRILSGLVCAKLLLLKRCEPFIVDVAVNRDSTTPPSLQLVCLTELIVGSSRSEIS